MNFNEATEEIRVRLAECGALLNHIRGLEGEAFRPAGELEKQLRAHWLVAAYASFERGINLAVEATLQDISVKAHASVRLIPSLHGVVHFAKLKSLRDCKFANVLDRSADLFAAAMSVDPVAVNENPFAPHLQNVDGSTIEWVFKIFGINAIHLEIASKARLENLRERRNAVSHGRESAANVGERFDVLELQRIYDIIDFEIARLLLTLENHCESGAYLQVAA